VRFELDNGWEVVEKRRAGRRKEEGWFVICSTSCGTASCVLRVACGVLCGEMRLKGAVKVRWPCGGCPFVEYN